jgi:hypothetical protein
MNRDLDKIIKFLSFIQKQEFIENSDERCRLFLEKYEEIFTNEGKSMYHLELMQEAGFFNNNPFGILRSGGCNGNVPLAANANFIGLSNYGHDWINVAKNDTIWNKIKNKIFSFDSVLDLALLAIKKTF